MDSLKQIIVIRKDLGMRAGKMVAQGAHASMGAILPFLWPEEGRNVDQVIKVSKWLAGSFAKICVRVESEQELVDLYEAASDAGIIAKLITDNGRTEFHGEPTKTALALGPDTSENLDPITGHLKLL